MATVVAYDMARSQAVVDGTVTGGTVNGSGQLMLNYRNNTILNAGVVKGPQGFQGPEFPLNGAQIMLFAGTVAPLGWVFCDGSSISRVNFSELFAAIGTTYGLGDGVTTFNVPDFRGRIPVGKDATQTEFDTLGEKGGAKTHTLTTEELPSHTHTVLGYSSVDDKNFTGNNGRINAGDTTSPAYDKPTGAVGGGAAHNNLQPYTTINYIIAAGSAGPLGGGIAAPRYFTSTDRGTSAQRDAKFGVPGTAAARVALANQQVTWYNIDLGWKERYYEVTASAGLTALGLVTGATPGWYPISDGPYMELIALAEISQTYDAFITGWSIYNRKGGTSWFTLTGTDRVEVLKHGRYDIGAFTTQTPGAALSPDYSLQVLGTDNVTLIKGVGGGAAMKDPTYNTRPHQEAYDQIILPNQKVAWKLQRGTMPAGDATMQVHGGSEVVEHGRLSIKYVGPPLNDL